MKELQIPFFGDQNFSDSKIDGERISRCQGKAKRLATKIIYKIKDLAKVRSFLKCYANDIAYYFGDRDNFFKEFLGEENYAVYENAIGLIDSWVLRNYSDELAAEYVKSLLYNALIDIGEEELTKICKDKFGVAFCDAFLKGEVFGIILRIANNQIPDRKHTQIPDRRHTQIPDRKHTQIPDRRHTQILDRSHTQIPDRRHTSKKEKSGERSERGVLIFETKITNSYFKRGSVYISKKQHNSVSILGEFEVEDFQRRKYGCEIWRRPDKENDEFYLRGDFHSKFLLRKGAIRDTLQIWRANGIYRIYLHRVIAAEKTKAKADLDKVLANPQTDLANTEGNAISPESEIIAAEKTIAKADLDKVLANPQTDLVSTEENVISPVSEI